MPEIQAFTTASFRAITLHFHAKTGDFHTEHTPIHAAGHFFTPHPLLHAKSPLFPAGPTSINNQTFPSLQLFLTPGCTCFPIPHQPLSPGLPAGKPIDSNAASGNLYVAEPDKPGPIPIRGKNRFP